MRDRILDYKKKSMKEILLTLPEAAQTDINKFIESCKTSACPASILKIFNKMVLLADTIGDLELNQEKQTQFLVLLNADYRAIPTKNDIKKIYRRFVRWKYPRTCNTDFNLNEVRIDSKRDKKNITKADLLTDQEIDILINSTESLKWKTILVIQRATGCRPEEVLKLKPKDIDFQGQKISLYSAKTKEPREIPVNELCIRHIQRYLREGCPPRLKNDDFMFPTPRDPEKRLTTQAYDNFLKIRERELRESGFSKHIHGYSLRYAILAKAHKKLKPKNYEMFAGHSMETGLKYYAHLDTDDLKEDLDANFYDIAQSSTAAPTREKDEIRLLKEEMRRMQEQVSMWMNRYWVERGLPEI